MNIIYDSQAEFYKSPFGAVTKNSDIKFRIGLMDAGIPDSVSLIYKFKEDEFINNMSYVFSVGDYCIYETSITVPDEVGLLWYYFEIKANGNKIYYSNNYENLGGKGCEYETIPQNLYQVTIYNENYKTPDWFKNSVVYQIFPDRFYNSSENGSFSGNRQDIIKRQWGETPYYKSEQFGGEYLANDFFGGNILGIIKKLPYLSELGITAIYLNPIFKAYSNHRYDTGDYMEIDETLGTYEDFCSLCSEAEKYGINIILDGVFNHTGSNSIYFNKNNEYDSLGAYQSKESPYYTWYDFTNWPTEYSSWWGMKTLPSINENSVSYRDFILNDNNSVVKHWIKSGAMGWRLDVVDELPGFFVKELRNAVKSQNPDAVIIGEVWEDASNKESYGVKREYFLGDELDSVMNYPLRSALIDFAKNKISAKEFDRRIMSLKENYPSPAYYSLLNILSTHDVERIITILSAAPDKNSINKDFMADFKLNDEELKSAISKLKQIVMLMFLMPGVPCIYYGDEIGMQGYGDPFCRCCFDWDNINEDIKNWFKSAISIRKSSDAFLKGDFNTVYSINNGYGYIRYYNDEKYVICSNFGKETEWFRLDLARFSIKNLKSLINEEFYQSEDGIFYIEMPPQKINVYKGK